MSLFLSATDVFNLALTGAIKLTLVRRSERFIFLTVSETGQYPSLSTTTIRVTHDDAARLSL